MDPVYDILIAGAGPAGCAAAYDLARAGCRVLLLDRRHFPRPKACACGLTRKTLNALRYSVAPVIERTCHEIVLQRAAPDPGAPPSRALGEGVRSTADKGHEVRVRFRQPICAMAVRERFDDFCLQQTLAAGASGGSVTLRKIESITALRETGGESSTHIELDIVVLDNGRPRTETLRAPALIGADGSNGQTRRLAFAQQDDPAWYTCGFALEALIPYAALPAQLPAGAAARDLVFDFSPLPGGYGWLFPKGDHINIGVGAFAADGPAQLKSVTRSLLAEYTRTKLGVPLPKEVTGQHLGMGGHAYVPRGRVLLTGDAAGLVDALTGEGIHSAIVSGQAAAAAVLEVLTPPSLSYSPENHEQGSSAHPAANEFLLSSRPEARSLRRSGESPVFPLSGPTTSPTEATRLAAAYARHLAPLQQTLAFSHRAARAFYADPARGFRAMKLPILRSLVLKTYADGLAHTRLLTALAKMVP